MKKIVKWIKKWSFFIMLFGAGTVYFTYTENWTVYASPLAQAEEWCRGKLGKMREYIVINDADVVVADLKVAWGEVNETMNEDATGQVSANEATGEVQDATDRDMQQVPEDKLELPADENGVQSVITYRNPEEVVYTSVEDDYFADALFIGDSRTVGMYAYGGLEEIATFYASTGLTVYKMFDEPIVEVPGQKQKLTVEEALQEKQFSKIYLMIGINEMGTGTVESFMEKYSEAVTHLKELQPNAVIYLQAIMKVTTARSQKGDYINNEGIEARNVEIAKLADNVQIYYLDVNPPLCDETGGIEEAYTFDGVHLKAQYVAIWKEFLKAHAVTPILVE